MAEPSSRPASSQRRRRRPAKDALFGKFLRLNKQFGEVVGDRSLGSDDYVTDPEELAKFPQPTDEEVVELVRKGLDPGKRGRR